MSDETAWLRIAGGSGASTVAAGGLWDIRHAAELDALLGRWQPPSADSFAIDAAEIESLDTAGAWLLHRTIAQAEAAGARVVVTGLKPEHEILLAQVEANDVPMVAAPKPPSSLTALVLRLGAATDGAVREGLGFVAFLGLVVAVLVRTLARPARLRLTSLVYHMEATGLNALPIVGLISFLIGVVLAYQGATQLQRFGAELFVVNLIAVSVLREIGILLTAIVVAGRSGSAFTAQIGSMKVREEVDAMRTLGLDPVEVLVLPRILALVLTLPLLAFFSAMMGLLGGGLMSWLALGIQPGLFVERLNDAVSIWSFWVGIIKAPFFALLIGVVGCYEGFQVSGSAESVGRRTTKSVVEAIFLVIVADAVFSIFFAVVGV